MQKPDRDHRARCGAGLAVEFIGTLAGRPIAGLLGGVRLLGHLTETITLSYRAVHQLRAILTSSDVKADKAKANFENGILTITRPIDEDVKPKSITIKAK